MEMLGQMMDNVISFYYRGGVLVEIKQLNEHECSISFNGVALRSLYDCETILDTVHLLLSIREYSTRIIPPEVIVNHVDIPQLKID